MATAPAATPSPAESPAAQAEREEANHLPGHITLIGAFGSLLGAAALAARRTGAQAPERVHPLDIGMVGLATFKLSRLISKEKVTRFARVPFTEFVDEQGEVAEKPAGGGVRYAVGQLLTCPFCLGQWISAGFAAGLVVAPRQTRLVAASYSAEAIADFLQLAWRAGENRA